VDEACPSCADLTLFLSYFSLLKLQNVILLHFASLASPAGPWGWEQYQGGREHAGQSRGCGVSFSSNRVIKLSTLSLI